MDITLNDNVYNALKEICVGVLNENVNIPVSSLLMKLMDYEGIPMHYPYHHFIMPAALLTMACISQKKPKEDLLAYLNTAQVRSKMIPGGFCGNCGACGAGVGVGIFVSVYTNATPHSKENWQWANAATGICLQAISKIIGPRCCKRVTFLAVGAAVPFVNENLHLDLTMDDHIICHYSEKNADCLKENAHSSKSIHETHAPYFFFFFFFSAFPI